ncbi:MAG: hypothetical protein ACOCUV_00865 [bacterium]
MGIAQEQNLEISNFIELAEKYKKGEQHYLAYINYLNYYMLSNDVTKKNDALIEALKICVSAEQFDDAEKLMSLIARDPEINAEKFNYCYSYLLQQKNMFSKSDIYLRHVGDSIKYTDDYYFLKSYLKLMQNQPRESKAILSQISAEKYDFGANVTAIRNAFGNEKEIKRKMTLISVPLSMVVPGLGQAYAGFRFDAVKNFGYNILFAYTTYASWQYELERPRDERNYFFPATSSVIFGLFYLVNIYNTINVTQKANMFFKNKFYKEIAQSFQMVLNGNSFQTRICIPLN